MVRKDIELVFAVSDSWIEPFMVLLHSIALKGAVKHCKCHVLEMSPVSDEHKRRVENHFKHLFTFEWRLASIPENVDRAKFKYEHCYLHLPKLSMFQIASTARLIFFDADMLVRKELFPLIQEPFPVGCDLMGCKSWKNQKINPSNLKMLIPELNTGLIIFNYVPERYNQIAEIAQQLDNKMGLGDQSIVNRWLERTQTLVHWVSHNFNTTSNTFVVRPDWVLEGVHIYHFTGEERKPWKTNTFFSRKTPMTHKHVHMFREWYAAYQQTFGKKHELDYSRGVN